MMSRLLLGGLLGWVAVGCAQERDPINRVQPNAVSKHFFVGTSLSDPSDDPEFFWRNYVVDASASQSLVGVGSWGHVDRIRWEVTQDMLIARKAYQIADGADNKGVPQKDWASRQAEKGFTKAPNGTIVAAYRIESHFDIRRAYNPQTGEESNIIEENTSDKPWNEREYMRVDWSKNLVENNPMWEDLFTGNIFGKLSFTPVSYYVQDPTSDDAIHMDEKQGYFDITNKWSVAPATSDSPFSDFSGQVPTCVLVGLYTGSSTYECDAQEATVRSSFLRIDPNRDFESLENTRATMDIVGNPGGIGDSRSVGVVSAGRQGWDPQYGYTDALYKRFAYIHNNWKKSHTDRACTANVDADGDGTADQCAGASRSSGSQCDLNVGKCTIPYRDREIKTIGYWVNKEAPDDLLDPVDAAGKPTGRGSLEDLIYSWNQLMSVALAYGREVECRRTGDGDRDSCHAQFFDSTNDPATKQMVSYGGWLTDKPKEKTPAITFCHNPVRDYDLHEVCGETGYKARVGDIRHNFIFYWPYESRAPWGGIANWNADPLTGEIIGGAAQIMGRSATYAAALQRDVIQIALGERSISDVMEGVPAQTYAKKLKDGFSQKEAVKPEDLKSRIDAIDLQHLKQTVALKQPDTSSQTARIKSLAKDAMSSVADPRQVSTAQLEYDALASKVRGSQYEAQIVDSHWLADAIGMNPSTKIDDSIMNFASPLRGLDPGRLHAYQDAVTSNMHARGVCFLDNEAPAAGSVFIGSLAGWFKNKYGDLSPEERGKAIYKDLWKEAVKGIGLHEIGHSLGMLHQFASSWDAPNYNPQYWQLRTNEGQAMKSCDGKPRTGDADTCMGPRYLDPETADEQGLGAEPRPGILYFANTSTMEYQVERAGETVGLGTYDLHTMKALYGRVLETFDDRDMPLNQQKEMRFKAYTQLQEKDLLGDGNGGITYAHYTETARRMQVFNPTRDCRPATDEEKATGAWRVVHGKVCSPPPKDHWAWSEFKSDALDKSDPSFTAPFWHAVDRDGKDRVRWVYRWGTTHNSYLHTNDSDAGADAYEVALTTSRKFDQTYPWAYFRRTNREYYYRGVPSQTTDRYFERMRSYHWAIATDLARVSSRSQLENDDDMRPYVMAENEIFNMLAKAILMPEPGDYYSPQRSGDVKSRQPVDSLKLVYDTPRNGSGSPDFTIGLIDGRYVGEEFDNDLGGSWDYLNFIKHAGFSVEKARAFEALVDARPTLFTISRDNFLDGRGVKINFRNDLPDAVDRLIGGILAEDWETVSLWAPDGDKNPTPQPFDITARAVQPTRPQGAKILFPNLGYKQQLSGVMFAALFSRLNTDMTLVNKMRLWIDGQVGGVNVPPTQQIRFTDPASGYTYIARKYGNETIDGKTIDKGISSRMLAHANALVAAAYKVQRGVDGKPVLDVYGAPILELDANGLPQVVQSQYVGQLTQYVGLLDSVREIGHKLGYGPVAGGGGED
jgi:hypothetical protein